MQEKLLLLDGHNLAYKAFFAIPELTTGDGRKTNAVYGVANMVLRILEEEDPTHVAFFLDKGLPAYRTEVYPEYKAHRDLMPEGISEQIPLIRDLVAALSIPLFEMEGYEADDCIATVVEEARKKKVPVRIVTGDKDLLQLVGPDVSVLLSAKGITDIKLYDEKAVHHRYQIPPALLTDLKALAGDPSDNIPGVPGIGDKTASKLVSEFGPLEEILARVDQVSPPRIRDLLLTGKDLAVLSKTLATLKKDVPLVFQWEEARRREPDRKRLLALFQDLDFRVLVKKWGGPSHVIETTTGAHTVEIKSEEALDQALERIGDTESTSLILLSAAGHPTRAPLYGLAFCAEPGSAWYVPITHQKGQMDLFHEPTAGLPDKMVFHKITAFLRRKPRSLWVHNIKNLEVSARLSCGEGIAGDTLDVMLASYLLKAGRSGHGLHEIVREYAGISLPSLSKLDPALITPELAGAAASALRQVGPALLEELRKENLWPLYKDVELPVSRILGEMETHGIALDTAVLASLGREMDKDLARLTNKIHAMAGVEFNLNSPKQLGEILFGKLGLPGGKRTKTGFATGVEVLEILAIEHEIAREILEYRALAKLKSTYVDALPRLIHPVTQRLHTSYNQTVTSTGRLSSSDPNLQNIPIKTELGREIRRAFIPRDPGWCFVCADYSQIELRILAHITGDKVLSEVFRKDEDIHTRTACELFGVSPSLVTSEMRRRAKTVNFGVLYGMGEFGLSRSLRIPKNEAKAFIERYLGSFPQVKAYIRDIEEQARETQVVTTLLGRRRFIPDAVSRNHSIQAAALRMAVNTPIQGSAADIMKLAMIKTDHLLREKGIEARMLMQVHDEIVLETPREALQETALLVKQGMETAFPLSVPLRVDLNKGNNWADEEPISCLLNNLT